MSRPRRARPALSLAILALAASTLAAPASAAPPPQLAPSGAEVKVSGNTVTVVGDVDGDDVMHVVIYLIDEATDEEIAEWSRDAGGPFSITWTDIPAGAYVLSGLYCARSDNIPEGYFCDGVLFDPEAITVDSVAEPVTFQLECFPAGGGTFVTDGGSTIDVTGGGLVVIRSGGDPGVVNLEVSVNGVGQDDPPPYGTTSYLMGLEDGDVVEVALSRAGGVIERHDFTVACGETTAFTDVPAGAPFHAEIQWLVSNGITTGYRDGSFRPAAKVERQAMAAFLYRFAGEPDFTPPATPSFRDVPTSAPFFLEIEWLASTRITTGWADGTFRPSAPVERQAMAAFLHRFAGEPEVESSVRASFRDVPVDAQFFDEVEWLASTEITTGWPDGTFRPSAHVERQAMAAFLKRFADWQGA